MKKSKMLKSAISINMSKTKTRKMMEIQITQILMKKKKFNHYPFQLETQIVLSVANGKNKIIDIQY